MGRNFGRNIDSIDAQRTTAHFAVSHDLPHDLASQIYRDGKAQTNIAGCAALWIKTGGINANQLATQIHQCPARIARINRGIGLNKILIAKTLQTTAAHCRNNARRYRLAQTKGITDRDYKITNPQGLCIGQGQGYQTGGLNLDHGNIGIGIRTNGLGFKGAAIAEDYRYFIGTFDHMIIGQNQTAFGIDNDARAQRLRNTLLRHPRTAKKFGHRVTHAHYLFGVNIYHRWRYFFQHRCQ